MVTSPHTPSLRPEQRRLQQSVLNLVETYRRLDPGTDVLSESLATRKMSPFLFEADEKAVVSSVQEAIDAAKKNLDTLAKAGEDLKSQAVARVVDDLRTKLAAIELDSGKFASIKDFAGFTIKQITFIANGIAQAGKDIDAAVKTTVSALETLKIDFRSDDNKGKPISELIEAESERTKIDSGKFMAGIKQKMSSSAEGGNWFFNAFKGLMGLFKGAKPVKIDADTFADELTKCTAVQLDAYLNSEAPKLSSDEGSGTDEAIADVTQAAGTSKEDIQAAAAPGEPSENEGEGEAEKAAEDVGAGPISKDELANLLKTAGDITASGRAGRKARKIFRTAVNAAAGKTVFEEQFLHSENRILVERWETLAGLKESKRR